MSAALTKEDGGSPSHKDTSSHKRSHDINRERGRVEGSVGAERERRGGAKWGRKEYPNNFSILKEV